VSYGGSSLMVTCVAIGVLVRVEMERLDRVRMSEQEKTSKVRGGAVYD